MGKLNSYLTVLTINILLFIITINGEQKFAIEPESQTAKVGTNITLPCRVVDKKGILQWTKDDFGLGTNRNLSAFDRYEMIGSDDEGDFTLKIDLITLEDDAKYQCQVSSASDGDPGIRSRYAQLTVIVPPDPPQILQGDFKLVKENEDFELDCIATGGKPAAELTWIDGLGNVITTGIKYVKELLSDGRCYRAKSTLKFKPQKEHHNTTFTCQSQNSANRKFKTAELKLEVTYAPKITLNVIKIKTENTDDNEDDYEDDSDSENSVKEGSEVRFSCQANGNPSIMTYKWFINDELVVGDYTSEMLMHNVSRTHHKSIIKCEVANKIGHSEEEIELDVIYPPVFKTQLKSVEADDGEDVELTCEVDGNPVEIVWVYDPIDRLHLHPRVVGTSDTLEITVSNETTGRYFCKASVADYPEIKAEAYVYRKQAPIINSAIRQYGSMGDTLRLECSAFSIPKARHISWSFKGREIDTNLDHEYSILEDPSPRGIKSTLIIRDSQDWHFGNYNCSVVNDYGTDVLQIELQHQNNFQFLMIIVGATSGVVIFVIIIVLFLCFKLKGKHQVEKSDKEKPYPGDIIPDKPNKLSEKCWKESDCSSHSSDYKPDIKASGSSESDYSVGSTLNFVADDTLDIKDVRREKSLPLAGTVHYPDYNFNTNNNRYSLDIDRNLPPKYLHNNYGYIEQHNDLSRYVITPTNQHQQYTARKVYLVPPSPNTTSGGAITPALSNSNNNNNNYSFIGYDGGLNHHQSYLEENKIHGTSNSMLV